MHQELSWCLKALSRIDCSGAHFLIHKPPLHYLSLTSPFSLLGPFICCSNSHIWLTPEWVPMNKGGKDFFVSESEYHLLGEADLSPRHRFPSLVSAKHVFPSSPKNTLHFINSMFYALLTQPFLTRTRLCSKMLALIDSPNFPNNLASLYYCYPHDTDEAPGKSKLVAQDHLPSKWQSQDCGSSQFGASTWVFITFLSVVAFTGSHGCSLVRVVT